MVKESLFWCVVASLVVYDALLVVSIARPALRFWPPPVPPSWRHDVMRVAGPLGPLSIAGVLALGALDWNSFVWCHWSRFVVGGLLFGSGGALALWGFFGLGVRASQGLGGRLRVSGAYRWSRNPQYVGAIAVLVGYGLVCNSRLALLAASLWSSWYLLAPFAEEPWLRGRLGSAYDDYTRKVRRFL